MAPIPTTQRSCNSWPRYAKAHRHGPVRQSAGDEFACESDGSVCEFCMVMPFTAWLCSAKRVVCVAAILAWRNPFQIANAVIRLVAISMIRLMSVGWRWTNENRQHQPTKSKPRSGIATAPTQGYDLIAGRHRASRDDAQRRIQVGRFRASKLATDATDGGNLIAIFPVWNVKPSLCHARSISQHVTIMGAA